MNDLRLMCKTCEAKKLDQIILQIRFAEMMALAIARLSTDPVKTKEAFSSATARKVEAMKKNQTPWR